MVRILSGFVAHMVGILLHLEILILVCCKQYMLISYIFIKHWYHCGYTAFLTENVTSSNTIY